MKFLFQTYFKKGLKELEECNPGEKISIGFSVKDCYYDCIFSVWEVIFEKIELDFNDNEIITRIQGSEYFSKLKHAGAFEINIV